MRSLGLSRYALWSCAVAALLGGCSGSQPPIGAPGVIPQSRAIATNADRSGSWMLPEAKSGDLLYVSDRSTSEVYVYTYPKGKLIQKLTGFISPDGECADKNGNVFIADNGNQDIVEYAHGAPSPKAILADKDLEPEACAVDPQNGDLAVTDEQQSTASPAAVSIFKHATGSPTTYQSSLGNFLYCGYDEKGDLFLDGTNGYFSGYQTTLAELPKDKKRWIDFQVDKWLAYPGGVQWDGKFLAVGNQENKIYRFSISNGKVTEVGKTLLGRVDRVLQFLITRDDVIGGSLDSGTVDVWSFPVGGRPLKKIAGFEQPVGVAISRAI